jgi:hypothetical protein
MFSNFLVFSVRWTSVLVWLGQLNHGACGLETQLGSGERQFIQTLGK